MPEISTTLSVFFGFANCFSISVLWFVHYYSVSAMWFHVLFLCPRFEVRAQPLCQSFVVSRIASPSTFSGFVCYYSVSVLWFHVLLLCQRLVVSHINSPSAFCGYAFYYSVSVLWFRVFRQRFVFLLTTLQ